VYAFHTVTQSDSSLRWVPGPGTQEARHPKVEPDTAEPDTAAR
jgi:hypothetical protein